LLAQTATNTQQIGRSTLVGQKFIAPLEINAARLHAQVRPTEADRRIQWGRG